MFAPSRVANLLKVDPRCTSQICITHEHLSKWQVIFFSFPKKRKKKKKKDKKEEKYILSISLTFALPKVQWVFQVYVGFYRDFHHHSRLHRDDSGDRISLLTSFGFCVFALQIVLNIALPVTLLERWLATIYMYPNPLWLHLTVSLHTLGQTQKLTATLRMCTAMSGSRPFHFVPVLEGPYGLSLVSGHVFTSAVMYDYILCVITPQ